MRNVRRRRAALKRMRLKERVEKEIAAEAEGVEPGEHSQDLECFNEGSSNVNRPEERSTGSASNCYCLPLNHKKRKLSDINAEKSEIGNTEVKLMGRKSPLKIPRTEFLSLIRKVTSSPKSQTITRPIQNSANDTPTPRCSRMLRPVFIGNFPSSDDDDEIRAQRRISKLPKLDPNSETTVQAITVGTKVKPAVMLPGADLEIQSPPKPVATSNAARKRKPKRKLTLRKSHRVRKEQKYSDDQARIINQPSLPEAALSPFTFFGEVEINELAVCLLRVEDQEDLQEPLKKFYKRVRNMLNVFPHHDVTDSLLGSSSGRLDEDSTPENQLNSVVKNKGRDKNLKNQDLEDDNATDDDTSTKRRKPIKCNYCSRFFANDKMLEGHESLHVTKTKVTVPPENFGTSGKKSSHPCQYCLKRFNNATALIIHIERMHSQKISTETYNRRRKISGAKKHISSRSNEMPQASITRPLVPPPPEIICLKSETIFIGSVKQESQYEVPETLMEDANEGNSSHTNGSETFMNVDCIGHSSMEKEEEDDNFNPFCIEGDSRLPPRHDQESMNTVVVEDLMAFNMANGVQCSLSNMGSILELLDGPVPNAEVTTSETLTLNYEGSAESGPYRCDYCPKICETRSLLQLHCKESHDAKIRKPYICLHPNCSQRFESSKHLRMHRNKAHSRKEDMSDSLAVLNKNSISPAEDLQANAPTSSIEMNSEAILKLQGQNAAVQQGANLTSSIATTIVRRNEDLLKGLKYKCKSCGMKFNKLSTFVKHEWDHTENSAETQCCPFCPRRFTNRKTYLLHTKTHLNKLRFESLKRSGKLGLTRRQKIALDSGRGIKSVPCQHCEKILPSLPTYISHINGIHANEAHAHKYRCPYSTCQKEFKHPWNFRLHLASHSTELDFSCNICGARFNGIAKLNCHKKNMHTNRKWMEILSNSKLPETHIGSGGGKRILQCCTACMKEFDATMEVHVCTAEDQTNFTCGLCHHVFTTRDSLKAHLQDIHEKIHCRICFNRVFKEKMNSHLAGHLGETKYQCETCRRPYILRESWWKHLKSKTHFETVMKAKDVNVGASERGMKIHRDEDSSVVGEEVIIVPCQSDSDQFEDEVEDPLADLTSSTTPTEAEIVAQNPEQTQSSNRLRNSAHLNMELNSLASDEHLVEFNNTSAGSLGVCKRFEFEASEGNYDASKLLQPDSTQESCQIRIKSNLTEICHICDEICPGTFGLGNHMFRAHQLLLCTACHFCSDTAERLNAHIEETHREDKLYCKVCKKLFQTEEILERHLQGGLHKLRILQIESDEIMGILAKPNDIAEIECGVNTECPHQLFTCEFCSTGHHTIQKLELHILHTHRKWLCTICLKVYANRKVLLHHRKIHVGESAHDCHVCMVPFTKSGSLRAHRRTKLHLEKLAKLNTEATKIRRSELIPLPAVTIIPEEAATSPSLNLIAVPKTCVKDDVVVLEEKSSGVRASLKNSNPSPGHYECSVCGKVFPDSKLFDEHEIAGHNMTLFKKVSNRVHKLFRSMNLKPQVFKCTKCRQLFLDSSIFKKHWEKFHVGRSANAEGPVTATSKKNDLTGIDSPNVVSSTVLPHMSTVTVFACGICDCVFGNEVELNIHVVTCTLAKKSSVIEGMLPSCPTVTSTNNQSKGSGSSLSGDAELIDLTEDDNAIMNHEFTPCNYTNPRIVGIANGNMVKTENILETSTYPPVIQSVYSLQEESRS